MIKKLLSLIVCGILLLSLVACHGGDTNKTYDK